MSQSLANIVVHLVFSTKGRSQLLRDEECGQLRAYIASVLKNHDSPLIEINSVRAHIHILFVQSKNHAPARIVEQVKTASSTWIKTLDPWYSDFEWQTGYGEFSVSPMHVEAVREYIRTQAGAPRAGRFPDGVSEVLREERESTGRTVCVGLSLESFALFRPFRAGIFVNHDSRAFSPGCHRPGLQPEDIGRSVLLNYETTHCLLRGNTGVEGDLVPGLVDDRRTRAGGEWAVEGRGRHRVGGPNCEGPTAGHVAVCGERLHEAVQVRLV